MTCPHDNISLPTSADPDTVCADCGAVLADDKSQNTPKPGHSQRIPAMTATRGRPRKPITDDAEIHVAVKLPPWIVEHIDTTGQPRGAFVARLALERLLQMTTDKKLISRLCDAIYG